jgi:hypothetical protein
MNMKKLTNTFKPTHRNEQNTNKTSRLHMDEFHALYELSLYYIFFLSMLKYPVQTILQAST